MTDDDNKKDDTYEPVSTMPDRGGAIRASALSKASTKFDVGNKGYLTEAERMARNFDTSNRGLLTNEKVVMIVEETMKLKEAHTSLLESMGAMKKIMLVMSILIVVLTLSNLGTSFVAVHLAKEITIGEGGYLRSTKDGSPIHTVGNGQAFDLTYAGADPDSGSPFACVSIEQASAMVKSAKDGVATSAAWINASDESTTTTEERGLSLTYEGSVLNFTHAILPSLNGGPGIYFDFTSHACDGVGGHDEEEPHNHRKLAENNIIRRHIFQLFVEGNPPQYGDIIGDDIKDPITGRRLTHNGCAWCRRRQLGERQLQYYCCDSGNIYCGGGGWG